jgi:hypothetical protein
MAITARSAKLKASIAITITRTTNPAHVGIRVPMRDYAHLPHRPGVAKTALVFLYVATVATASKPIGSMSPRRLISRTGTTAATQP